MNGRLLLVPAAGRGTRLRASLPKVLFPVCGRPMLDHLLERYAPHVEHFVLVLNPAFADPVQRHCRNRAERIDYAFQERPTGMLDALLAPLERVRQLAPERVWITWCDQVAILPETAAGLAAEERAHPQTALFLPTMRGPDPYVHLQRGASGRIERILHRREGDPMPASGESDMGLFSLSRSAYLEDLPAFADREQEAGLSGERNFLPFIPWLSHRAPVRTFAGHHPAEAIGVNDAQDLRRIEEFLRRGP